jgi:hypothetical protein
VTSVADERPEDGVGRSAYDELRALAAKYREMRELRQESDADRALGRPHLPSRARLRALAGRFPGALAETDRIAPALLDRRIASIAELLQRGEPPPIADLPTWIRGWMGVHRGLRGALVVKAWLAGRRTVDDDTRARFDLEVHDADARVWRDRLSEVASPPNGRLVAVVFADVAHPLGLDATTLRELLMPRHPAP